MRPIDADALIDELSLVYDIGEAEDDPYNIGVMAAIVTVKRMPTNDAVPVVRCKDCKHWGMHKSLNIPWCFEMHIDKSEDGFCDSGERREE